MSSALVLGGAGFLGGWLVDELLHRGVEVTVVDRHQVPDRQREVNMVRGEASRETLGSVLSARAVDTIYHLAGPALVPVSLDNPQEDLVNAVLPTLDLLEVARRLPVVPRIVYVSSAAVYGEPEQQPVAEDHRVAPKSPYGISKLACEHYLRFYLAQYGVPSVVVRPFSLYGPGQSKLVVHDLARRFIAGEDPLVVAGPADVTRDFVYVRDAARSLVTLAEGAGGGGEAFNLASGRGTSLEELTGMLARAAGVSPRVEFTGTLRAGDPRHWVGDPRRAAALGAVCDTPMEQGIAETVAWVAA